MFQVFIENFTFQLNLKKSIQENASNYYEKAKRDLKKLVGLEKAIQETRLKIEEFKNQKIEEEQNIKVPLRTPKREWFEKFRWFYSSNGFLVIGGKDASTNEYLIKRQMEDNDVVFHADIPGAPFVLIKTEGKTFTEQTIKEAAQLAASYSRAWKEMLTTTNVYWVSPQQVSKHPPSGEYLSKGSFMIYGKRNHIKDVPLEVAIGIIKEDTIRVIGGPADAVAKKTKLYVKIVPGKKNSGELAKEIKYRLAKTSLNSERDEILKIPLEEIQRFIPSGKGDLLNDLK
jgi:predicted ribosome quality control (RQC) complex YloA/Tae2 family protein